MAGWLRRAGVIRLLDGRSVTWSVAEGRRGRRWRETVAKPDGDGIRHSLLLEMDADDQFAHLELSTRAGLLTLHPEGDGTLHGNAVTDGGIEHVRGLPWDSTAIALVDGSLVSRLAAFPGLARVIDPGATRPVTVLRIPSDLQLLVGDEEVSRGAEGRWTFVGPETIVVDQEGLLRSSSTRDWPLEETV
jgi:hypothetical protein